MIYQPVQEAAPFDKTTNPMPTKMYNALRRAHDEIALTIVNAHGGEDHPEVNAIIREENETLMYGKFTTLESMVAFRERRDTRRIAQAKRAYLLTAQRFHDAPTYEEMVRYVIYGTCSTDVSDTE